MYMHICICLCICTGFSVKGWWESILPSEGNDKFCWGRIFLLGGGNLRTRNFDYSKPFTKLKATFCKY